MIEDCSYLSAGNFRSSKMGYNILIMSEKRKPVFVFLLENKSNKKRHKIEVYRASDFKKGFCLNYKAHKSSTYRIRVDGRFWPEGKRVFLWKTEIMKLIAKSIKF
jgi:hypothetical protein